MILYMENLKDHLETVKTNQYIQVARYKINMQKSFVFLYNNNKVSKKKSTVENNSIHNSIKTFKHSGISLSKEVRNLCTEKYKTLT